MQPPNMQKLDFVRIKLVKEQSFPYEGELNTPGKIAAAFGELLSEADREMLLVLSFNSNMQPIHATVASIGTLNCALVNGREIFKSAILSNAANLILLHNHPSGNVTPSKQDDETTKRMIFAGMLLGIPVVDHLILGGQNQAFFSYREHGNFIQMEQIAKEELLTAETPGLYVASKRPRKQPSKMR